VILRHSHHGAIMHHSHSAESHCYHIAHYNCHISKLISIYIISQFCIMQHSQVIQTELIGNKS